jgi:hypothetical protein
VKTIDVVLKKTEDWNLGLWLDNSCCYFLGNFDNEEEANRAYECVKSAVMVCNPEARLNFMKRSA